MPDCVCSDRSTNWPFPVFLPLSGFPVLKCINTEIISVNNPTVFCKYSRESKNYISLTLSKKLETIKLCEEGMSKVKIGWN
jgi:hypothetical protein